MAKRFRRWLQGVAAASSAVLVLSACAARVVDGQGAIGTGVPTGGTSTQANAPDAHLPVQGLDPSSTFDQQVMNALSDIEGFWQKNFPKVSGGKALQPLRGGLYSVDGKKVVEERQVTGPAASEACIKKNPAFIVDNGAFCLLDDSIVWDRAPTHLFAQLADKYGPLMVALVFAHEFGHAISYRLGVFDSNPKTILTESQADCAAGAWARSALDHQEPHFRNVTAQDIDDALEGFLDGRDSTPGTIDQISHGNGFDRLSALADGLDKGVTYCYSSSYFDRTFTERPFATQADYNAGGNTPFEQVIAPGSQNPFVKDLNRYWTAAAKTIDKTFPPVQIAEADHPKCGTTAASLLDYCPDDNTVYYNRTFAEKAYNSLPDVRFDQSSGDVELVYNQPADFALGTLFAIGWGLSVRHELFKGSMANESAFSSAICYTGAYAKDINIAQGDSNHPLTLSPADLDEAVSILLNRDLVDQSFGTFGTTGLDRVQKFVQGYKQGLSSC